ncbi:uncharacterized protein [Henckelia pumila]|uniref:uncharacterized protein n=1 Tax=Henckelia pumila TaxID=405737 RepID=UPI003C6E9458
MAENDATLIRLFRQLYFPPALCQAKAIELLNLKQGTLTIDEYQQKFIDLLPYCPHIGSGSEAKYDHFLQGLNLENFDRVIVCDDPTLYEGLVNRSGSFYHFVRQKDSRCEQCRRRHPPGQCRRASGTCIFYGEMGHLKKDCPNHMGAASGSGSGGGSHATVQKYQQSQ